MITYNPTGCCIDTRDPVQLAWVIAAGLIHMLAQPVAVRACKLIAEGVIPDPGNLPLHWANYVARLRDEAAR